MPAAGLVPAAATKVAAVTATPAAAPVTDTESGMGFGLWKPERLQWRPGAEEEEDFVLAQPLGSAACEDAAPAVPAAARQGGSENERAGPAIERRCCEPASAEQNLAVHAAVHAAEPAAVPAAEPAAVPAAVLADVQVAVLPAALAAD